MAMYTRTLPPTNARQFSHLGVPAPAGMSDCYESKSRILIGDTNFPSIAEREKCSAGACPQPTSPTNPPPLNSRTPGLPAARGSNKLNTPAGRLRQCFVST